MQCYSGRVWVRIVCSVASLITMNFMQKPLAMLALLMLAPAALAQTEQSADVNWLTDVEQATELAIRSQRPMLVVFR